MLSPQPKDPAVPPTYNVAPPTRGGWYVEWLERGGSSRQIPPSYLDLTFHPRTFSNRNPDDPDYYAPAEFRPYSSMALDAYATAILNQPEAAGLALTLTCALCRGTDADPLAFRFTTLAAGTPLPADHRSLLHLFPLLLAPKAFPFRPASARAAPGCVLQMPYPGRMIPSAPALRNAPKPTGPAPPSISSPPQTSSHAPARPPHRCKHNWNRVRPTAGPTSPG